MGTRIITISMDEELLKQIDHIVEALDKTRSQYFRDLAVNNLREFNKGVNNDGEEEKTYRRRGPSEKMIELWEKRGVNWKSFYGKE